MTTTTRFVGTCPVCQGRIKVRGGTLVHHGYERPGYGHIVGDCFGVHRLPHETSPETAKAYREVLEDHLVTLAAQKAHVEGAETLTHAYTEGYRATRKEVRIPVKKGDDVRYEGTTRIPSFDTLQKSILRSIQMETEAYEGHVKRVTALIDTWTKQDLTTVEEETAKGRAEAQAKRDEKQAVRDQKKAEKAQRDAARAASAQAKADKAVAKCLPILEAMDATDVAGVRKAYLKVLQLKLPITESQRSGFFEAHLPESHKATLKAAGLVDHHGHLMTWDFEVTRLPPVK